MNEEKLAHLLEQVKNGQCGIDEAIADLKRSPAENLGFACLDHHRTLRTGIPEVVFGENKSAQQICQIFSRMVRQDGAVMATRVSAEKAEVVCGQFTEAVYHESARIIVVKKSKERISGAPIVIASAGTSDMPVAEEAKVTAEALGYDVQPVYDVGVAGIHRLYNSMDILRNAAVVVVVAGMEGALPSVVAGLIDKPVIAVPTSVGYGAGSGGVAALLGMLNSCAPGMSVVNIDNGFGGACMAVLIARGVSGQGR